MFDKIIAYSIGNKAVIGAMTLALVVWGVWSAFRLPIDAVPDITNNQVQVITQAPSLGAQEVEQFITAPIELALSNIPDVLEKRSISRSGISVITVVFRDKTDIYWARQQVGDREAMPFGHARGLHATGAGCCARRAGHRRGGSAGRSVATWRYLLLLKARIWSSLVQGIPLQKRKAAGCGRPSLRGSMRDPRPPAYTSGTKIAPEGRCAAAASSRGTLVNPPRPGKPLRRLGFPAFPTPLPPAQPRIPLEFRAGSDNVAPS